MREKRRKWNYRKKKHIWNWKRRTAHCGRKYGGWKDRASEEDAPFNIYAAYYLQAVQRVKASLLVSLLQSILLCTAFLYLFPLMFGPVSIWYVMLFAEIFTAIAAILLIKGVDERVNRFLYCYKYPVIYTGIQRISLSFCRSFVYMI